MAIRQTWTVGPPAEGGNTGAEIKTIIDDNFKNGNIRVYNVEDYGAVHDGVTDDTAAIQSAINTCYDAGGGTVFFPNGTYIIGGALQNNIGSYSIDYNSQLYIPHTPHQTGVARIGIKLLGESFARNNAGTLDTPDSAVVLKSTIAGTGTWPSVLCAMGDPGGAYGRTCYTVPIVENINIMVAAFESTTGPSVSGINFLYSSHCILENVVVTVDIDNIQNTIISANRSFGIAVGAPQNDHPIIYSAWVVGFYYNLMLGEGVLCHKAEVFWGYIGFHLLAANVPLTGSWLHALGCKYSIASQQETFYEITAGTVAIDFQFFMFETDATGQRCPTWSIYEDCILDAVSRIKGYVNYDWSDGSSLGNIITRSNGGINMLLRNIRGPRGYQWTTGERSFSTAFRYIIGYNSTTGRMEYFTGGVYKQLTEDP